MKGSDIVGKIILELFDKDGDGKLSGIEQDERERIERLNRLSLEEFVALPEPDRRAAEEIWTAKVIEGNAATRLTGFRKL